MSETQAHHAEGHGHEGHGAGHYKKIYFTLLGLLVVSIAGPFVGILIVTLVTAFGIALVKANLVIQNFMHLKEERRIMKWMLATSLMLMALMFAGLSVDILNHEGRNWENLAAKAAIERGIEGPGEESAGEEGGEATEAEFTAAGTFGTVCAACHGRTGHGDGAAAVALNPKPANFTDPVFWETRDRERIVNVITNGAQAVFGGSAQMVPFRDSYSPEQIQELADYVMEFRPE